MDDFRDQLRAKQASENDDQFAARLGVSRSYWTRLRTKTRPITAKVARRAVAQWPDLEDAYLADVRATLCPRDGDRFAVDAEKAS